MQEQNIQQKVQGRVQQKLDPKLFTLFRLDGHSFSKFVKQFKMKLPFDDNFTTAMKNTAVQGFSYFSFFVGFVGSDQITYAMRPLKPQQIQKNGTLEFNGRVQKMVSLLAGKISTTFFIQLSKLEGFQKTKNFAPHFDCRVFQVNSLKQVLSCIAQRVKFTIKNSRMMLAQTHFSQSELNNVPSRVAVEMLLQKKGINYNQVVNADNRVGNILCYERVHEQKEITVKGQTKLIEFDRKKCRLLNYGPKQVEQIKQQFLI